MSRVDDVENGVRRGFIKACALFQSWQLYITVSQARRISKFTNASAALLCDSTSKQGSFSSRMGEFSDPLSLPAPSAVSNSPLGSDINSDELGNIFTIPYPISLPPIVLPRPGDSIFRLSQCTFPLQVCTDDCCIPVLSHEPPSFVNDLDTFNSLSSSRFYRCPSLDRLRALHKADFTGYHSIQTSHGKLTLFPLWVLRIWWVIAPHHDSLFRWRKTIKYLEDKKVDKVLSSLRTIPWNYDSEDPVLDRDLTLAHLAELCGCGWFRDAHIDSFVNLLNDQLRSAPEFKFLPNTFGAGLISHYKQWKRDSTHHLPAHLARPLLQDGRKTVGFCLCIQYGGRVPLDQGKRGNHWVAVVVDIQKARVHFADPKGDGAHHTLSSLLDWWICSSLRTFQPDIERLPCGRQDGEDDHNCGAYAVNAIYHHFAPESYFLARNGLEGGNACRHELCSLLLNRIRG